MSILSGRSRAAGREWRAFLAQCRVELLLASRRGENLLVTIAIPLALLLFFTAVPLLGAGGTRPVDELVPGVLALAVISTGLVSLGIATAYERGYGVLKRLLGSPLPLWALLGAKALVVVLTVVAQAALIAAVGSLLGWRPPGGVGPALLAAAPWLLLGTVAFSGLGLLLAGTLRPEAVLAAANGLFLVFLLLGGIIVPLARLPAVIAVPASLLPPALLANLLRSTLGGGGPVDPLAAAGLAAWAIGLAAAAVATFRAE